MKKVLKEGRKDGAGHTYARVHTWPGATSAVVATAAPEGWSTCRSFIFIFFSPSLWPLKKTQSITRGIVYARLSAERPRR